VAISAALPLEATPVSVVVLGFNREEGFAASVYQISAQLASCLLYAWALPAHPYST